MDRATFKRLILETADRPSTFETIRAELERQTVYCLEPRVEGLDELARGVVLAIGGALEQAEAQLVKLASEYARQPLCHYYLFAVRYQLGATAAARTSLAQLQAVDSDDPMAELLRLHLDGQPIPGITEEVRLAQIRKLASTPLLKNPYLLAVGAMFEEVRNRERARVMDVGAGSGAQMVALLGLLQRHPHRLRRLEIIGLDFVDEFLTTAERNISAAAGELAHRTAVTYRPLRARVEELDERTLREVISDGPLDAVNATITLHEVPGEAKVTALEHLQAVNPRRLVLAEWNFLMENVLPETSVEFLFNARSAAAAWTAALRRRYPLEEAREVVRGILTQSGGQLTCPAATRQECYLDVASWHALLDAAGFRVTSPRQTLVTYAESPERVGFRNGQWHLAAYEDRGTAPLILLEAVPR